MSDKAFDGRGNYALGIREQLLFPEIEYDKVEKVRGMEMIFVTTAHTDEECKELLRPGHAVHEVRRRTIMAKTSMINKQQKEPKFSTRAYTRCRLCGRPHSVLRKYGVCRICFRELAYKGQIPASARPAGKEGLKCSLTIPLQICSPASAMLNRPA